MAHGVYPSVKEVESARLDSVIDRPHRHPGREHLRSTDHAVLSPGERPDHLVSGKRDALTPYSGVKASRLAHAPNRADPNATEHTPSMPKFA